MRKISYFLALSAVTLAIGLTMTAPEAEAGRGNGPVIYVRSQGLYFDSIVTADPLPPHGPFQLLEMVGGQLETDFGPKDKEYAGGRWWMDSNGSGEMDEGDHFFSCPLLPPGRDG
jgi:hypothetical protein